MKVTLYESHFQQSYEEIIFHEHLISITLKAESKQLKVIIHLGWCLESFGINKLLIKSILMKFCKLFFSFFETVDFQCQKRLDNKDMINLRPLASIAFKRDHSMLLFSLNLSKNLKNTKEISNNKKSREQR